MPVPSVIFVSATSADLGPMRDLVVRVLAGMGIQTRVQPTLPTSGQDLQAKLRELIDECGLVIQLVGLRYGESAPVPDPEFGSVSYTQFEARYAEKTGKRVLFFLLSTTFPFQQSEPESVDKRERQAAYRESIRSRSAEHPEPASAAELETAVLRLRDDLAETRREAAERHAELHNGIVRIEQRVEGVVKGFAEIQAIVRRPSQPDDNTRRTTEPGRTWDLAEYLQRLAATFERLEQTYTPLGVALDLRLSPWPSASSPPDSAETELTVRETMEKHHRVFIIGDPGSGKTTSLQRMALEFATCEPINGQPRNIPVYVELARFVRLVDRKLVQYHHEEIEDLVAEAIHLIAGTTASTFPDQVRQNYRFVYLFDGLNEVADEDRERCCLALRDFLTRHPTDRCVVTSRKHAFVNRLGLPVFEVQDLSNEQIAEYVARYIGTAKRDQLVQQLPPSMRFLATNPLVLRFMIEIFLESGTLPKSRGKLLQAFVGYSLRREASEKRPDPTRPYIAPELMHDAVMPLGFAMQTAGQIMRRTEAEAILGDELERLGHRGVAPADVLDGMLRNGILHPVGTDRIRFWHQTLQEYFTAARLLQYWHAERRHGKDLAPLRKYMAGRGWHEVLAVMAGLASTSDLSCLLAYCRDTDVGLAAMCIGNSSEVASTEIEDFLALLRRRVLRWMRVSPATVKMACFWSIGCVFMVAWFSWFLPNLRVGSIGRRNTAISYEWGTDHDGRYAVQLRVVGRMVAGHKFDRDSFGTRVASWYFEHAPQAVRDIGNVVGPWGVTLLPLGMFWWGAQQLLQRRVLRHGLRPPLAALRLVGTAEARTITSSLFIEAQRSRWVPPRYLEAIKASQLVRAQSEEELTRLLVEDALFSSEELQDARALELLPVLAKSADDSVALGAIRSLAETATTEPARKAEVVRRLEDAITDQHRSFATRMEAYRRLVSLGGPSVSRPWPGVHDLWRFLRRYWVFWLAAVLASAAIGAAIQLVPHPAPVTEARLSELDTAPGVLGFMCLLGVVGLVWWWHQRSKRWEGTFWEAVTEIFLFTIWPITATSIALHLLSDWRKHRRRS